MATAATATRTSRARVIILRPSSYHLKDCAQKVSLIANLLPPPHSSLSSDPTPQPPPPVTFIKGRVGKLCSIDDTCDSYWTGVVLDVSLGVQRMLTGCQTLLTRIEPHIP